MRSCTLLALSLPVLVVCCGGEPPPPPAPLPPPVVAPPPPPSGPVPPETPKQPVSTTYHGVSVTDDYAWLEAKAPKVTEWSDAENAYARAILDALPDRPAIKERVTALVSDYSPSYGDLVARGKTLFVIKHQPPKQQGFLITVAATADQATEKVLLDPNLIDISGKTTIDFFVPSHDGKRVAVSLSSGGSESGDVHVYDVATGLERQDNVIPKVNGGTAGGSVAWAAGDTGFFYTRYPHPGERPPADAAVYQQVYFHKLNTDPDKDFYAVGKDFPRIAEIELESSPDGRVIVARVANGDGGEYALYVHDMQKPLTTWTQLSTYADKIVGKRFGPDGALYLHSQVKPHGEVLRLSPATLPLSKATVIVPEGDAVISHAAEDPSLQRGFVATATRLYVVDVVGGPSQVRIVPLHPGKSAVTTVPIPPVSQVAAIAAVGDEDLLFRAESYTEPPGWYRFTAKTGKVERTPLHQRSPADYSDTEVVREQCTSKDGTKVPISIMQRKGAVRDGSGFALLTGYGGFATTVAPRFRPLTRVLLEEGVVFAEANLRGGSEFGEEWHRGGSLTNKQNVFDDFYACAKLLADEKIAPPQHLAIQGKSNGGLLMGVELTQHPDAFRVVVSHVGIYDSLHYENTFNGAFCTTEYGSVKDDAQFKALRAYSPLHNVKDGVAYPSVLLLTGANDPRVEPYNSRKMAARLQAANAGKNPVLLRTSQDTGHGAGTPLAAEIEEGTDSVAFVLHELGVAYRRAGL